MCAPRRCPRLSFLLFFSSLFSFLAHCSHDLFFLSICPWVREHIATFPLLRATLHYTISILCVCVCMLIDFFLPIPVLFGQTNDGERTNERTNERRRRREEREREKLNHNHSAAVYIYIYIEIFHRQRTTTRQTTAATYIHT